MYKNLESKIKFYWKTIEHTLNVILAHTLNVILAHTLNVILAHTLNVIFDHTLNVILGFVPRIHAKQNLSRHYQACPDNLDPRDKPEDENRMRMFFKPEDDKDMRLSTSILKHLLNVILGFIPRIYAKHYPLLNTLVKPEYCK